MRTRPPVDPRTEPLPPGYHTADRLDVLPLVPENARRFLEVGAALGHFGHTLRSHRAVDRLVGIEPEPMDVDRAQYDAFINDRFPSEHAELATDFDCVVFNDVIEHMADPWEALEHARGLLAPGGSVVISLPNIFNVVTLYDLIVKADWPYRSSGVLDVGHLRFFTRRSLERMLTGTGFAVAQYRPLDPLPLPGRRPLAPMLRWRAIGFSRIGVRGVPSSASSSQTD